MDARRLTALCDHRAERVILERTAIVGAGAVGASIAAMMMEAGRPVALVADDARAERLDRGGIRVNGERFAPRVDAGAREGSPYDLVVVAVKSMHLSDSLPLIVRAAGSTGIVMSLLNGISSESIIRDSLAAAQEGGAPLDPARRVVPAMILGIDAVRVADGSVTYLNRGTIHYGADAKDAPVPEDVLASLGETFDAAGIPSARSYDIVRTLWWKFMINVGINQASAVLRAPYGVFQRSQPARELMGAAMDEVIRVSEAVGSRLTQADLDAWFETLATLDPTGKTSMLQDVEAGRPSEVDLFAGTVVRLGERYGVPTPVNRTLAQIIRASESIAAGYR